ncbi:hypothetical protein HKD37_18G051473 [Glycine soja]
MEAMAFAKLQEDKINDRHCDAPLPAPSMVHFKDMSPKELASCCEHNLCYYYDEKFTTVLLGDDDDNFDELLQFLPATPPSPPPEVEDTNPLISIIMLSSIPALATSHLYGTILGSRITILINDSCQILRSTYRVHLCSEGDGWGNTFLVDLYVLSISGIDLWLKGLGPITTDYGPLMMTFSLLDRHVNFHTNVTLYP